MDSNPPTALRRLWMPEEERTGREPRVGLSRSRIVPAAIELADEGGLEAVSMSRLAQRLGFTTMSLYRHVTSKEELLLLMHDAAWRVPGTLDGPFDGWRGGIIAWCQAQREILHRHPWLERIRVTDRVGTPSQLTWLDRGLRFLAGTPLHDYEKSRLLLFLSGQVLWDARVVADFEAALRASGADMDQATAAMRGMFQTMADADRFPFLSQAVVTGAFDQHHGWQVGDLGAKSDEEFMFGLAITLDGVEHLIARRAAEQAAAPRKEE